MLELKQIKANWLLVRLALLTFLACAPCTSGLADLEPRLQIFLAHLSANIPDANGAAGTDCSAMQAGVGMFDAAMDGADA